LVSATLLFQYDKLVDRIVSQLERSALQHKNAIQVSCAFGDVTIKIVTECHRQGAGEIVITDIIENELSHVKNKLGDHQQSCTFVREDALHMRHANDSFDVVMMFFLLHELPGEKKHQALKEASRILKRGGKLIIGELHQPTSLLLKVWGWVYFKYLRTLCAANPGTRESVPITERGCQCRRGY